MNSRQQDTDVVSLTRTRVGVFVFAAGVIGFAAAAVALTPQGRSAVSKIVKGNKPAACALNLPIEIAQTNVATAPRTSPQQANDVTASNPHPEPPSPPPSPAPAPNVPIDLTQGLRLPPALLEKSTDQTKPSPLPGTDFVPGEVIVKFRETAAVQEITKTKKAKKTKVGTPDLTASKEVTKTLERYCVTTGQRVFAKHDQDEQLGKFVKVASPEIKKLGEKSKQQTATTLLAEALRQDANSIESVDLNWRVHTTSLPNDTYIDPDQDGNWSLGSMDAPYADLWGLKTIKAVDVWPQTQGADIVVAVVDSGVDTSHIDLSQNIWSNPRDPDNGQDDDGNGKVDDILGWDFVNNDNTPSDDYGHGTHVAGIAAAVANNNEGIAGVAPQAKIMAVKTLDQWGSGTIEAGAAGILYAADAGAHVINLSWTGYGTAPRILVDAVNYAHDRKNAVVVAAAGNSSSNAGYYFPANIRNVITVAATDERDRAAAYTNGGAKIDVAAPGGGDYSEYEGKRFWTNIISLYSAGSGRDWRLREPTLPVGPYITKNGTSMAAPQVSGLVALLRAYDPALRPEIIRMILRGTARDIETPGRDTWSGSGLIDAVAAVAKVDEVRAAPKPDLEIFAPEASARFQGNVITVSALIRNQGNAPAVSPAYRIFDVENANGPALFEGTLPALNPDEGTTLSQSFSTEGAPRRIGLRLDPTEAIAEHLETNNFIELFTSLESPPWPKPMSGLMISTPTVDDLDNDGRLETVITTFQGEVTVLRHDGTVAPGWPKQLDDTITTSPAIADLNQDGIKEIVHGGLRDVYVWEPDGSTYKPSVWPKRVIQEWGGINYNPAVGNVDPSTPELEIVTTYVYCRTDCSGLNDGVGEVMVWREDGTPARGWETPAVVEPGAIIFSLFISDPVIGDVDGDGLLDVLVGHAPNVFIFHGDGRPMIGWPSNTIAGIPIYTNPAVADLDGDGQNEVISGVYEHIAAWRKDGTMLPGWPRDTNAEIQSSVTLGDLNADGRLEVVVASRNLNVYAIQPDGSDLPGWPVGTDGPTSATPSLVDVNGDGRLEVILNGRNTLNIYQADGRQLPYFPQQVGSGPFWNNPIVADFDGNGLLEIMTTDGNADLHRYTLPWAASADRLPWGTFRRDNHRSGIAGATVTGNPPAVSFLRPSNGATVSGTLTIEATATDDTGIDRVEFFRGSTLLGTDREAPYSIIWDTTGIPNGAVTLMVKAFDTDGRVAVAQRTVTVENDCRLVCEPAATPRQPNQNPPQVTP